ncbi:MAG: hypothetical protein ACXQTP_04830 [Candidatus Methanofastidiosia archaeon]
MKIKNIFLILIVTMVFVGSACISGDGNETTSSPTTAAPTTSPPSTTQLPTTPPSTTAAPTTSPPTTQPPTTPPAYYETKEINMSDTNGGFKVTILEVGYFRHPKFGTAGPEVVHFRIDLKIENLLNAKRTIYPNINSYLVDNGGVRWPVYFVGSQTLISGDYDKKEVREGYLVFEDINGNSSIFTFTIEIPTANLPVKIEIEFEYP